MEKLTVPGRSNLKAQCKDLCQKDERKICYTHQKKKQTSRTQTGEGDFSVENLGLLFQSIGNAKQYIINRN